VPNPSKLFLAERPDRAPGSAVLCCVEGSRPMLVEIQALVSTSSYGNARRMASGVDQNRLSLLLAVLEKRAGLNLVADDVFVNVAGGLAVDEPAADLAVVAAIASSVRNRPILAPGTAVFGEVGLAGEVRGVSQAALRVREVGQMGFTRCVLPDGNCAPADAPEGLELVGVRSVRRPSTSSWISCRGGSRTVRTRVTWITRPEEPAPSERRITRVEGYDRTRYSFPEFHPWLGICSRGHCSFSR
jgi:DNA repair protein RadA/Sms